MKGEPNSDAQSAVLVNTRVWEADILMVETKSDRVRHRPKREPK